MVSIQFFQDKYLLELKILIPQLIGTARYSQVEELFKKKLGLNQTIKKRFEKALSDFKYWEYYEHIEEIGIQNSIDPDYRIVFVDIEDTNKRADSFSLSQIDVGTSWGLAKLEYKNNTIEEISVVHLDGGRFTAVVPDIGSLGGSVGENLYYSYYLLDSFKFLFENLINNMAGPISPDNGSLITFAKSIVVYSNSNQKMDVENYLGNKMDKIKKIIEPQKNTLEHYKRKLEFELPNNSLELSDTAIKAMIKEVEVGKYIKSILKSNLLYSTSVPEVWR